MSILNNNPLIIEVEENYINEVKSQLPRSTGNLINSVRPLTRIDNNMLRIGFTALDYIDYVLDGRGPGRFPPSEPIKDWVIAKGIPYKRLESTAFLIGRSIANKGTKGKRLNDINPKIKISIDEKLKY